MSVTGIALVLFITFHGCMNVVALISKDAYNTICALLGSNWYAIAATLGLAALVVIHIIYAFILTIQNRKARGNNKYAVTEKPDKVEWASQNMLVLGIIICLGLLLHLFNFWYNMMFLTHGMWSAMQTLGLSGHIWFKRWKCIGQIWSTVVMAMFLIVVLGFWLFPDYVGQYDFKLLPFAVN